MGWLTGSTFWSVKSPTCVSMCQSIPPPGLVSEATSDQLSIKNFRMISTRGFFPAEPSGFILPALVGARQMMMQKAFYDGWVDAASRAAAMPHACLGESLRLAGVPWCGVHLHTRKTSAFRDWGYPLVIQHGNGKSHVNESFNRKIAYI